MLKNCISGIRSKVYGFFWGLWGLGVLGFRGLGFRVWGLRDFGIMGLGLGRDISGPVSFCLASGGLGFKLCVLWLREFRAM